MFLFNVKFYFLLVLFIFSVYSSNSLVELEESVNSLKKYTDLTNKEVELCNGKLYNDDLILNDEEVFLLCQTLASSPLFILRIKKKVGGIVTNTVIYESKSFKFFNEKCKNFSDISMCNNGFLIDFYTVEKVIIIEPGKISKNKVKEAYRNRVLEAITYNLGNKEWFHALDKSVKLLDYKLKDGVTELNAASSEPNYYMWTVVIPVLIVMFIFLTLMLSIGNKGKINKNLFDYIDKIIAFWTKIECSEEKAIVFEKCFLCFDDKKFEKLYKFRYCNHRYHEICMSRWKLLDDKCCPCSYEPVEGEESGKENDSPPLLKIEDLRLLLSMILDSYRKDDVYEYFTLNAEKVQRFNRDHEVCLEELCWIYLNKLETFKTYRIFFKMHKVLKLMCCILAFYPSSFMNSKKGRLIKRLMMVKSKGGTVARI